MASISHTLLRFQKFLAHLLTKRCSVFNLLARPFTHPKNPLEFFLGIKPASGIAEGMSGEIVRKLIRSTGRTSKDVVGCELLSCGYTASA